MALGIYGYTMCRVRLVCLPLEVFKLVYAGLEGWRLGGAVARWSYFSRYFTVRVLAIAYSSYDFVPDFI